MRVKEEIAECDKVKQVNMWQFKVKRIKLDALNEEFEDITSSINQLKQSNGAQVCDVRHLNAQIKQSQSTILGLKKTLEEASRRKTKLETEMEAVNMQLYEMEKRFKSEKNSEYVPLRVSSTGTFIF
eukprot:GHVN01064755.1.p1 GENE.GHVN01064755.1~~GHVN01064755.1.p1  ORF type:complete len:127 (+),score=26.63 GHVN01064755.1:201-581(+)